MESGDGHLLDGDSGHTATRIRQRNPARGGAVVTRFLQAVRLLQLVGKSRAGRVEAHGEVRNRFRLEVLRNRGEPTVRVTDLHAGKRATKPLLEWRGSVVRQMQNSGVLSAGLLRSGVRYCDKSFVQHLALAAASAELANEDELSWVSSTATHAHFYDRRVRRLRDAAACKMFSAETALEIR